MASELGEIVDLPIKEIFLDQEFNCRGYVAPIDVVEFAQQLARDKLQNPIQVQYWSDPKHPEYKYRIIAGHRRTLAFRINKKETIPAIVRKDIITNLDAKKANLIENLHRKNLNIKQEAHAIQAFDQAGWPEVMISEQTGQSRGWVKVRLQLLTLPDDIQDVAAAGLLTQEHIKMLYGRPREAQYEFVKEVKEAKARGEKIEIEKPLKKINPHERKFRPQAEIRAKLVEIYAITGMGLHTRCMAFCAGDISEYDLMKSIEDWAKENGIEYKVPEEMVAARFE